MCNALPKTLFLIFAVLLCLAFAYPAQAQANCSSPEEVKEMIGKIEAAPAKADKKLSKELIKMREKFRDLYRDAAYENFANKSLNTSIAKLRDKNDARLCEILKTSGWPTKSMVGLDATEAAFYLLRTSSSVAFQANMLPVISAAIEKGEFEKSGEVAALVDALQIRAGKKQIFGTQYSNRGDFDVLYPLASELEVDGWRKDYKMRPLADGIKISELTHRKPILRSLPGLFNTPGNTAVLPGGAAETAGLLPEGAGGPDEVIKVESTVVSLPVFVYNAANGPMEVLAEKDFEVYENGAKQEIAFYSAADTPYDLVLLLDLSGSTEGKLQLIREATNRFVESKRPADRLAIVAFADEIKVVSPLTADRQALIESVKTMGLYGNSRVWDALKYTLEEVIGAKAEGRRKAVVFMTDGVDNTLYGDNRGSKISFGDLFESVKKSETTIFPVYIDTSLKDGSDKDVHSRARSSLNLLADETGGQYYKAAAIADLQGVYRQVLFDLSRVYTIGYIPSNDARDGLWRKLQIKVPGHPELTVKTKQGYYAR